jgi:hypothetical protein
MDPRIHEPLVPKGLSPTEAAKVRQPTGARPGRPTQSHQPQPVKTPINPLPTPVRPAEQFQPGEGVPVSQFVNQAQPKAHQPNPRSKAEVEADLMRYQEGLEQYAAAQEQPEGQEEPETEKSNGEDDMLLDSILGGGLPGDEVEKERALRRWRKVTEEKLEPMSIQDLILKGEIRQKVPIIPGVFEATFRTPSVEEDLEVKRTMYGERGADRYVFDLFSVRNLTIGLHAIGGRILPSHMKEEAFDEELFKKKLALIQRWPVHMVRYLVLHYSWFDERVNNLFTSGDLGNG